MITTHSFKSEFKLTDAERQRVLFEIYSGLGRISPDTVSPEQCNVRGGLKDLERHLDEIVDVVHRSTADHVEPYLAQFLDDVCSHCPNQEPSAHCPLRYSKSCVLFGYPQTIIAAVRDALQKIQTERELS